MPFQDFSGNPANEQWARSLLVPGEELVAIVAADRRTISITDRRIILNEGGGQFSAIRNDQIAAIEVSDGRDQKFLKLHFG